MKTVRIIGYALIPVIFLVAYALYVSIKAPVERKKYIDAVENKVIEKLKIIEELQIAYLAENGEYAKSGQELKNFVKNGKITITQKTEEVVGKKRTNPLEDSIKVTIDTIEQVPVSERIWSKYEGTFELDKLDVVPGSKTGKRFAFFTDVIKKKGGVKIPVMQVTDTDPINPARTLGDPAKDTLRIGSTTEPITGGNWRK